MLGPLAGDLADPAGGGMEHDGLARFHGMDAAQQILRGHAFEHGGGGDFVADAIRQLHQLFRPATLLASA